MTPLIATLFLLASPAAAQTAGGGFETLRQWEGGLPAGGFGYSCANAGDVNADGIPDQIVGAYVADGGGILDAGSAFVYSGADGSLLYQFDGEGVNHEFGVSVSGAGDVNLDGYDDVIVGALYATQGPLDYIGSAYVYSGIDGSLLYQWDGTHEYGYFGRSVSGAGDVNSDGYPDLIVGALATHAFDIGSAYVYSGFDGSLIYSWDGPSGGSKFGYSVSDAGDLNSDGVADVIVGAPAASPGGSGWAGSVFAYSGADGTVIYQWDGTVDAGLLGLSVDGIGDINGDGVPDVIAGAPYSDVGPKDFAGVADVYSGADGSLLYRWTGGEVMDLFGHAVSCAGDVNADGIPDLIVGADEADINGMGNAGYISIYSGADGTRIQRIENTPDGGRLGTSVSDAGDVNGDGYDDVMAGALWTSNAGISSGTLYLYDFRTFLTSSKSWISALAGGLVKLSLNFPPAAAGYDYKVLISASGIGPTWYGVNIPLTQDAYVVDAFFGIYPVTNSSLHGTLNVDGDASGNLTLPAGMPSGVIGNTYYFAAIASPVGQLPEYSSKAVSLYIAP